VLLKLVRIVLGCRECQSRRDNPLDGRIVCVIKEERDTIQRSILLKVLLEETRSLHVHTHRRKDNGEVVLVSIVHVLRGSLDQARLSYDLRCNLRGKWVRNGFNLVYRVLLP
jgi:hypothetical protein